MVKSLKKMLLSSALGDNVLRWMPDKSYLQLYYYAKFKKWCDFKNPIGFNEKLQWLKLYNRKDIYTTMVDKYAVKDYVAARIGGEYIIPTLGVWDSFDDIDFDTLPQKFVLKCTHDSGGLVICRDKSKLDKAVVRKKIQNSLERKYYYTAREWPYKNVKPRIIAECYMADATQVTGLRDYKFYCFHGEPRFLYVSQGLENHETAAITFLNLDWTVAPFQRGDYRQLDTLPEKPANYEAMITISEKLSEGVPFLRVDLYEINGKIYFSELTFSPCGGMMVFHPECWDDIIGGWITLPEEAI